MDTRFTVEESNLICIFAGESRSEVIKDIQRALPYLEDTDMLELSGRVIGKLRDMTDEEFEQLELTEAEQNIIETGFLPTKMWGGKACFLFIFRKM